MIPILLEILVYSDGGVGASINCVTMTTASLRDAASRANLPYVVRTTTSKELVGSKWRESCRLLVMPGGRDLPYCEELDGQGNGQISSFVQEGGSYLGICAGAYYGSAYVEFAQGDPDMEVVGPRELAFLPVTAKGPVFPGYSYETNEGAHSAGVAVTKAGGQILGLSEEPLSLFYNGGCNFAPRGSGKCSQYQVMLTYTGQSEPRPPNTPSNASSTPGVIGGRVGEGKVMLSGLHFEASVPLLEECYHGDDYVTTLLPILKLSEHQRRLLFDSCLLYLLNKDNYHVPDFSTDGQTQ